MGSPRAVNNTGRVIGCWLCIDRSENGKRNRPKWRWRCLQCSVERFSSACMIRPEQPCKSCVRKQTLLDASLSYREVIGESGEAWIEIPLSRGLSTKIDVLDRDWASRYTWHACDSGGGAFYAATKDNKGRLHRMLGEIIFGDIGECLIDHANRDRLDNRRRNLRIATTVQNAQNTSRRSDRKGRYRGAWPAHQTLAGEQRWVAQIKVGTEHRHIGTFTSELEAARAYDAEAIRLHGSFAVLNFPTHEAQ